MLTHYTSAQIKMELFLMQVVQHQLLFTGSHKHDIKMVSERHRAYWETANRTCEGKLTHLSNHVQQHRHAETFLKAK